MLEYLYNLMYDNQSVLICPRSTFQVALIVFLSHIGSFVPADAATIGLTDRSVFYVIITFPRTIAVKLLFINDCNMGFHRIFCAMGSKHMTAEQSTFMIDLHQVGLMLRYSP